VGAPSSREHGTISARRLQRESRRLGVSGEQLLKRVLGDSDVSVTVSYNRHKYLK
jgi:hypothetical protein